MRQRSIIYEAFLALGLLGVALLLVPAPIAAIAGEGGPPVNLELKDADLRKVLMSLGEEYGISFIVDEAVSGRVTASIKGLPLWDALGPILRSGGYDYQALEGGMYVIAPMDKARRAEEGLIMREFRLDYLRPTPDVMEAVKMLLSERGGATSIGSANSIVVKDFPLVIERVGALLAAVDRQPGQVLIEAKIVELTKSASRELGIKWGESQTYVSADMPGGLGSVSSDFGVNLPAASEEGLSVGVQILSDRGSLDLRISALEETGDAKVLSHPRVMVMENHEAQIASGMEILIPTTQAATVIQTYGDSGAKSEPQMLEAKLLLSVTPRITRAGGIAMSVITKKEEFDFTSEFEGYPPKSTRSAKTDIILNSGETLVIGGIYSKRQATQASAVPWVSAIPVLGYLFKSVRTEEEETELLIFIEPKIYNGG